MNARREALRIAIAGAGFAGRLHARAARLAGARIVGVSASTTARAETAAAALGAERGFATSDELVASPDVDVVHICTPNNVHAELAAAAIAAGKHVVCEKPLAVDARQARALVDAAATAGVVATVPFVYRFYPVVREIRQRLTDGRGGPIHLIHGTYLQDWLLTPDDDNWRVDAALGGPSRTFADIGSHWCDLMEFMSGQRITRLVARTLIVHPERTSDPHRQAFEAASGGAERRPVTTEDAAVMSFETDAGAIGTMVVSQVSAGRKNRLWIELDGSESFTFDQEHPDTGWIGRTDGMGALVRDPARLSPEAARFATVPAGHPQGYQDCFDAFVADTYAAIRGERPDGLPRFEDGLRAATIIDAVLASSATGEWVTIQG